MLAFLGWNPGTPQELFNMQELIESFSLERVGKAGAKFDFDKTNWFNQQYLRAKPGVELASLIIKHFNHEVDQKYLAEVCEIMKERATFAKDIFKESQFFFSSPSEYDAKTIQKKWKENTPQILTELAQALSTIDIFSAENVEAHFKSFMQDKELGFGAILPPFRLAVTGLGMGPSMFHICALLGKKEVLNRISVAVDTIKK
jgi:glutamyl-tRNA synthetase